MSLRRFLPTAAAGLLISLLVPQAAKAESDQAFHIPAGPLDAALTELADQAGIRLLFRQKLVNGRRFPGLNGTLSLDDALTKALAKQPLGFRHLDGQTVIIEAVPLLPSVKPNPRSEAVILEPVRVTGYPPAGDGDSYNPPNAQTATRTETPSMETPFSLGVVPRQILRDQQISRVDKALENVSGVMNIPSGVDGDFDVFRLRGFLYGDRIYREGVPIPVGSLWNGQRSMANIERVEVLKGPPSFLYGRTEPGGLVNLLTKKPRPEAYQALSQQLGSFEHFRTTLESTGPMARDLSYRLDFEFDTANSFRELVSHDRKFVSPQLRWNAGTDTEFTAEAEFRESENAVDPGLPLVGGWNDRQHPGRIPQVPISRNYGDRRDRQQVQEGLFGIYGSHRLNENWTVRQRFNAVFSENRFQKSQLFVLSTLDALRPGFLSGQGIGPDDRTLLDEPQHWNIRSRIVYNTLSLTGQFETFGLAHTLLMGADFNDTRYESTQQVSRKEPVRRTFLTDLYTLKRVSVAYLPPTPNYSATTEEHWLGIYAQDQIQFPFGVQLLVGLRYDHARDHREGVLRETTADRNFSFNQNSRQQALTPRFGLIWQPVTALSFYGNTGENFGLPNLGATNLSGQPLPAQKAVQWELGVKAQSPDGNLGASLAAFRITNFRMPTVDPACSAVGISCSAALGSQRSQGLELDLKGEPWPHWKLIGTYTYLETEVLKDVGADGGRGATGLSWADNPAQMGSLWTTYEWTEGPLAGLSLGGGAILRGQRQSAVGEPGYILANLMAAYGFQVGGGQLSVQLNIDNLFDKRYWLGTDWTGFNEYPGTPRTVSGTVRLEW